MVIKASAGGPGRDVWLVATDRGANRIEVIGARRKNVSTACLTIGLRGWIEANLIRKNTWQSLSLPTTKNQPSQSRT